jgi:hypothetical protein
MARTRRSCACRCEAPHCSHSVWTGAPPLAACALRTPALSAPPQVESARKLRWYDRDDLSQLVALHTAEKLQLQAGLAALRQARASCSFTAAGNNGCSKVPCSGSRPRLPASGRRASTRGAPARARSRPGRSGAEGRAAGRQALLRRGVDEDQLDAEARELLAEAAGQQGADEGVSMVLLLAAQEELGQARRALVSACVHHRACLRLRVRRLRLCDAVRRAVASRARSRAAGRRPGWAGRACTPVCRRSWAVKVDGWAHLAMQPRLVQHGQR